MSRRWLQRAVRLQTGAEVGLRSLAQQSLGAVPTELQLPRPVAIESERNLALPQARDDTPSFELTQEDRRTGATAMNIAGATLSQYALDGVILDNQSSVERPPAIR